MLALAGQTHSSVPVGTEGAGRTATGARQARSVVLHDVASITLSQNALCLRGTRIVSTEAASSWAGNAAGLISVRNVAGHTYVTFVFA